MSKIKAETSFEKNKQQTSTIHMTKEEGGRDSYLPILLAERENKPVGSPCVFDFDGPKKSFLFYR
jgi:hypothetical protein